MYNFQVQLTSILTENRLHLRRHVYFILSWLHCSVRYLFVIVILVYMWKSSQGLHNTYTIPLQQRVHWGSFWSPDMGLGMGLPSLGIGDLTGDFKFLILSVGDTPVKNDRLFRDTH